MPPEPFVKSVALALVLSVALLTVGAASGLVPLALVAAALFAAAIIASAVSTRPIVRQSANIARDLGRHHTLLAAMSYAWAAASFAAVYSFSDLVWYHAYQYGIGAALGAFGLFALYRRMTMAPPPITLTALHGLAALGGLFFLAASGKLMSLRSDWPGNIIFVAGGLTLAALCFIAVRSQQALRKSVA